MANNESSGWVSRMETMLASVTSERLKPCSIFRVPEQLRKSEKEAEAYTPKVVSIGPLHKGTKTELPYMEEIKYHCMLSLLRRTDDAPKRFSGCSKAILELDDSVRAFYVDDIKFNNYELAKIMVLDGCFLLELLISNAEQSYPGIFTTLQSFSGFKFHIESSKSDAAAEIRNKGEVLSDLKLIENQIPLLVLVWLFQLLFIIKDSDKKESDIEKTYVPVRNTIHRLALLLFGCSPSPVACEKNVDNQQKKQKEKNIAHLVELVHAFLTEEQGHRHSITIKTSRTSGERVAVKRISGKRNYKTAPKMKCCAARIKIKPVEEQSEGMKQSNDDVTRIEIKPVEEQSEGMKQGNDDVTRIEIKPVEEQSEGMKQSNDDVTRIEIKPVEEQSEGMKQSNDDVTRIENKPVEQQSEGKKQSNDGVKFFCYTNFINETLVLHPLNITEETEILWRNLIAWEQNRITREKYLAIKNDRTSCKFSEFALLFNDLVCCEHDIKLLKDQKVLIVMNEKNWSNEKLMTFFHTVTDGIQIDVSKDSKYVKMIKDINGHFGACVNRGMIGHKCRGVLTYTWYRIRTSLETLKRDHTPTEWKTIGVIAATLLVLLTIAQTVLTAIDG